MVLVWCVHFLSNTLRKTRAAAVKGLDEQSMSRDEVFVGQKGKDFDFADLRAIKVEIIECSAKGDAETDLKDVHEWLNKLIWNCYPKELAWEVYLLSGQGPVVQSWISANLG